MNAEQLERIGLAEDATDEQITARLEELVENEETGDAGDESNTEDESDDDLDVGGDDDELDEDEDGEDGAEDEDEVPAPAAPANAAERAPKTVMVDKEQFDSLVASNKANTKALASIRAEKAAGERDTYLRAAMAKGKFAPAQLKGYKAFWDAKPQEAKAMIDGLAENSVPIKEVGQSTEADSAQDDAYPTRALSRSELEAIAKARQGGSK